MQPNKIRDILILLLVFLVFAKIFYIPWVIGDGMKYFAITRSVIIDRDVNFSNEYGTLGTLNRGELPKSGEETVTGKLPNAAAVGTSIFMAPFFLVAHLIEIIQGMPAQGYSQTYFSFVTLGNLIFSFMTLLLVYSFLFSEVSKKFALVSTISIFICSSLFYYTYHDPSMSHVYSAFLVSLFVYYAFASKGSASFKRYLGLGIISGLMILVRWQDALFLVVLLFEFPRKQSRRQIFRYIVNMSIVFIIAVLSFSLQMIFWKEVYGGYLSLPPRVQDVGFFPIYFFNVLFSTHGLLIWTPIIALSFIGYVLLFLDERRLFYYLSIPLALQLFFVSCIPFYHGSWSYGIRYLTNSTIFFAIGICFFLKRLSEKLSSKFIIAILFPFYMWNLLLMTQIHFNHALISQLLPFSQIFHGQFTSAPGLLLQLIRSKLF